MKKVNITILLCFAALLMQFQQAGASILVDYFRLPQSERERVTKDQATWDTFKTQLIKAQSKAMRDALGKLQLDGLSKEERWEKINTAIEKSRDPAHFNMEKDWHIIGYLLTGDATLKEKHLPNAPLHNVIFGGLNTSVETGYGVVRYFDSKLVAETAAALEGADRKVIADRYDPVAMKKLNIYAPPELNEKKAILQVIEELTLFFKKAADSHEEVIVFVW